MVRRDLRGCGSVPVVDEHGGPVIGVIGGSGGVGASSLAAVVALAAAPAVLVDLDPASGGADVVLGADELPGARWSGLRVAGGRLDPGELVGGLPTVAGTAVLAADVAELDPDAVAQVIAAAASTRPVVLDLPRAGGSVRDVGLAACDLVAVLARADVGGLVAAHAVLGAVEAAGTTPSGGAGGAGIGVVVRRGHVPAADAAVLVGAPLLGELPPLSGAFVLDPVRPPRPHLQVAQGLLAGLLGRPRRPVPLELPSRHGLPWTA